LARAGSIRQPTPQRTLRMATAASRLPGTPCWPPLQCRRRLSIGRRTQRPFTSSCLGRRCHSPACARCKAPPSGPRFVLPVCLTGYPSVSANYFLSFQPAICLSVCRSVCRSVCLSVVFHACPTVCPHVTLLKAQPPLLSLYVSAATMRTTPQ
jgi:hypothetical protein